MRIENRAVKIVAAMSLALSCGGCSKDKTSKHAGAITALAAYGELQALAKKTHPKAVLLGIVSSADWISGLALATGGQIDASYNPDGRSPSWDYYFAKSPAAIKASDKGYAVDPKDAFGTRYAAQKEGAGKLTVLASDAFKVPLKLRSKAGLAKPPVDSDAMFAHIQREIGHRFASLAMRYSKGFVPRRAYSIAYAVTAAAKAPIWEASLLFADASDYTWGRGKERGKRVLKFQLGIMGKSGATGWFDGASGKLIGSVRPFRTKLESRQRAYYNSRGRRRYSTYRVHVRDYEESEKLLKRWNESAATARRVSGR